MPLDLPADENAPSMDVGDVVDWLRSNRIDTSDEASFIEATDALRGLANNRRFLADQAVATLKEAWSADESVQVYTAQVMMLHAPAEREDNFFVRANIWPAETDPVVRAAGTGPFFYHRPHDHNFNFLTVGYLGPGYGSNYYEYDPTTVSGYPGEHVPGLTYKCTSSLGEGQVMLYRASRDVHDQLPPDSLSISLNIVESSARSRFIDQYAFDLEKSTITQIINISPAPAIFSAAMLLDEGNARDVLTGISQTGSTAFARVSAHRALALASDTMAGYADTLAEAFDDQDRMVREWARQHIAGIRTSLE